MEMEKAILFFLHVLLHRILLGFLAFFSLAGKGKAYGCRTLSKGMIEIKQTSIEHISPIVLLETCLAFVAIEHQIY